jgi:hypothetical protein
MEVINQVRSFFVSNYGHVNLDQLTDGFIQNFLDRGYVKELSFERKMDCLYDYVLSQGLCDVEE